MSSSMLLEMFLLLLIVHNCGAVNIEREDLDEIKNYKCNSYQGETK